MHTTQHQEVAQAPTPTTPGSRKGSAVESGLSPWASPTARDAHGQPHVQPSRNRRTSLWGMVRNPYLRADAAKEHNEETPSTIIAKWSSFKRRVIAVLVILFSLFVLTAAFYMVIGPLMSQMTHKPETTGFVVATRHEPDSEARPKPRFGKPRIRPRGAVEQGGCVRSFANCSVRAGVSFTAYRCTRPGVCETWKPYEYCLAGGARFDTMNKCWRACHNVHVANNSPCAMAEACPCRGDYRTANYVHRAGHGCRRLADHLCLVQPAHGFTTLALCRRECGAQGHNTTGQSSARCGSTASTRPCGLQDRQHRIFWDGHACRHWDASVCPPDARRNRQACRRQCVGLAYHSAAATGKPFATSASSGPTTVATPSPVAN